MCRKSSGKVTLKNGRNDNWVWLPERNREGSRGVRSRVQDLFSGQTKVTAGLLGTGCSYGNSLILLKSFRFLSFHWPFTQPIDVLVFQDALTLLFPPSLHFRLCQSSSFHSFKTRCWFLMPHVSLQAWPLCPLHTDIADCSRHSHAILTMLWNEILAVHRTNNNFLK